MVSSSMKIALPVLVVAILGFSIAFFLSSPSISSVGSLGAAQTRTQAGQNVPPQVWSQAPFSGWEYIVMYSTSTGQIQGIVAMPTQQVIQNIQNCGGISSVLSCLFPQTAGQAVLNATTFASIGVVASHMNAYSVNLQTQQIQLMSGWTNCTNPNYGNGTTPCS